MQLLLWYTLNCPIPQLILKHVKKQPKKYYIASYTSLLGLSWSTDIGVLRSPRTIECTSPEHIANTFQERRNNGKDLSSIPSSDESCQTHSFINGIVQFYWSFCDQVVKSSRGMCKNTVNILTISQMIMCLDKTVESSMKYVGKIDTLRSTKISAHREKCCIGNNVRQEQLDSNLKQPCMERSVYIHTYGIQKKLWTCFYLHSRDSGSLLVSSGIPIHFH